MKLQPSEAASIRERIMNEMLVLEEERMEHMKENREETFVRIGPAASNTLEDESIIRRELNKADPSAVVFSESWSAKKSRVRQASPYGHLGQFIVCLTGFTPSDIVSQPTGTAYRSSLRPAGTCGKNSLRCSSSSNSQKYGRRRIASAGRVRRCLPRTRFEGSRLIAM